MMRHEIQPGDHVVWFRSKGRSILGGWKIEEVPGIVERICKHRVRIKVQMDGKDRIVNVDPDNLIKGANQGQR